MYDRAERLYRGKLIEVQRLRSCHGGGSLGVRKGERRGSATEDDRPGKDSQARVRKSLKVARLRIIANRRAEAAHPRWMEDVRARTLTIANGEGTVHGRCFSLKEQYGIRLKAARIG